MQVKELHLIFIVMVKGKFNRKHLFILCTLFGMISCTNIYENHGDRTNDSLYQIICS